MRRLLAWLSAAALATVIGCGGNVLVGDGDGNAGGDGGDGNGVVDVGGAGGGSSDPNPTGGAGGGNAIVLDQGYIELRFLSAPLSCQAPDAVPGGCGWWQVVVALGDNSLFTPGAVIDFESAPVKVYFQEVGFPNSSDPTDCPSGAGGGGLPGKLVIQAIGDTEATVELQGMNGYFLDGQPDGVYKATRCN